MNNILFSNFNSFVIHVESLVTPMGFKPVTF